MRGVDASQDVPLQIGHEGGCLGGAQDDPEVPTGAVGEGRQKGEGAILALELTSSTCRTADVVSLCSTQTLRATGTGCQRYMGLLRACLSAGFGRGRSPLSRWLIALLGRAPNRSDMHSTEVPCLHTAARGAARVGTSQGRASSPRL